MKLQELLQAVASGHRSFQAAGSSAHDLEAFQPVARLVMEAGDAGYIEGVNPRKESFTGRRMYSVVMVKGLTEAGRQLADG